MNRSALLTLAAALLVSGWTTALVLQSFAAHMAAHVLAVAVAAPLLAMALPVPALLAGGGAALVACAAELVVVWGWHLPVLHAAARGHLAVFAVEQFTFVLAGYAVWSTALAPGPRGCRRRASSLTGVGALLLTSMHMTLLGGLLVTVPGDWYSHAMHDPQDHRLGGAIMLTIGGLAYLGGALTVLARTLSDSSSWRDSR